MAGYRELGVLLAAAALLATAVRAVDDDHMMHWKCFKSCTTNCNDDGDALDGAIGDDDGLNVVSAPGGGGVSRSCKAGCLHKCFEDLPVLCYQKCVVGTCLNLPPYSKEKMGCMKKCCDKCFHYGPAPNPPTPKPGPGSNLPTPAQGPAAAEEAVSPHPRESMDANDN